MFTIHNVCVLDTICCVLAYVLTACGYRAIGNFQTNKSRWEKSCVLIKWVVDGHFDISTGGVETVGLATATSIDKKPCLADFGKLLLD